MSDKDCNNCLNKSQKKAFGEDKIIGMPTVCMNCLQGRGGYFPKGNNAEYNPEPKEPINWKQISNEQSMEIEHLHKQLQANKAQIKRMQEGLRNMFSVEQENVTLKAELKLKDEALEKIVDQFIERIDEGGGTIRYSLYDCERVYYIAKQALEKLDTIKDK